MSLDSQVTNKIKHDDDWQGRPKNCAGALYGSTPARRQLQLNKNQNKKMNNEKTAERSPYKNECVVAQLIILDEAIQRYDTLVDRIKGQKSGDCSETEDYNSDMPLESLLDALPEILDGFSSDIRRVTNVLEEALY